MMVRCQCPAFKLPVNVVKMNSPFLFRMSSSVLNKVCTFFHVDLPCKMSFDALAFAMKML